MSALRCLRCWIVPWVLAAAAGCAAPQVQAPVPAPVSLPQAVTPSPAAEPLPPPAEELETFPLVEGHPAVAADTAVLAAAQAADRPALLMRRVRDAIAAAQKIRAQQGNPINLPAWAPDHERYLAFYDLALRDLTELLAVGPDAPEAPEAWFTMGMIHDYPHLDLFDEALEAYQRAVQRFPDSPWAARARERLRVIGDIMNPGGGDPHGGAGSPADAGQ